jgi:hypothetical protein
MKRGASIWRKVSQEKHCLQRRASIKCTARVCWNTQPLLLVPNMIAHSMSKSINLFYSSTFSFCKNKTSMASCIASHVQILDVY